MYKRCQKKTCSTDLSFCLALQLGQCANAMRTSPNSFAADYSAICNYADFQADVISPQRPAFVLNDQLG